MIFLNSFTFVTYGSFTADGGLLLPTVCVNTTPQMPREYGAKHVKKWLQVKVG